MIKIDTLYFLLLIELALILFALSLYFFSMNRKNKDLYQKTLRKLNDFKSEQSTDVFERQMSGESAVVEEGLHENMEQQRPLSDTGPTAAFESEHPEGEEAGETPGKVRRLQRMVNFQKSTILELMCYKDVFEGARKRLAMLQQSNSELQEKVSVLVEGGAKSEGLAEAVAALEENHIELDKYISIIEREDTRLSEKFQVWEEEFKNIAEDVTESPDAAAMDDAKYSEILHEKETLVSKVKEFEENLDEKSKHLESMQAQYEDLEKEYMILYRQQQQNQGEQPQV